MRHDIAMVEMPSFKEQMMRYTPAALALALLAGVTASNGYSAPTVPLDPRAAALLQTGRAALSAAPVKSSARMSRLIVFDSQINV